MGKAAFHFFLIILVGLIAYSNTFAVPFIFDDYSSFVYNPVIKDLDNFISSSKGHEYNPRRYMGYLTFALNYHVGRLDVRGYHIVNLAIHITNAILVYFLVVLTFKTPYFSNEQSAKSIGQSVDTPLGPPLLRGESKGGRYAPNAVRHAQFIALFSALLFVSHPVQTQAVTYIVQRVTSLATMFYLLSVVMYIKARLRQVEAEVEVKVKKNSALLLTLAYFLLSFISAVFAMKTKEIAFTLPIVVILFEFVFFRTPLKRKLLFLLPMLITLIIIPLSVIGTDKPLGEILSDLSEKTRVQTEISRWDYMMTEIRVIVTYIRLVFFPINQNLDYDYPIFHSLITPSVFLSFLFLVSLLGTAVYLMYRNRREAMGNRQEGIGQSAAPMANSLSPIAHYRLIAFGIFWFFITLSVESSVIPIADVIFEHRVYLPSAGAFIAITASLFIIVDKLKGEWKERVVFAVLVMFVLSLSGITYARNKVWQNEGRLWEDVVKKSPQKARPHYNLGIFLREKGLIDESIREYRTAVRLDPGDVEAHNNLGNACSDRGLFDEAVKAYQTALRLKPGLALTHYNIGNLYSKQGLIEEAMREYQNAIKLDPEDAESHNNLGGIYFQKGLMNEALAELRIALKLRPDYPEAQRNLDLITRYKWYPRIRPENKAGSSLTIYDEG